MKTCHIFFEFRIPVSLLMGRCFRDALPDIGKERGPHGADFVGITNKHLLRVEVHQVDAHDHESTI